MLNKYNYLLLLFFLIFCGCNDELKSSVKSLERVLKEVQSDLVNMKYNNPKREKKLQLDYNEDNINIIKANLEKQRKEKSKTYNKLNELVTHLNNRNQNLIAVNSIYTDISNAKTKLQNTARSIIKESSLFDSKNWGIKYCSDPLDCSEKLAVLNIMHQKLKEESSQWITQYDAYMKEFDQKLEYVRWEVNGDKELANKKYNQKKELLELSLRGSIENIFNKLEKWEPPKKFKN